MKLNKLLTQTESNTGESRRSAQCIGNKGYDSNTNKAEFDSKRNRKIKVLKYSNIEYAKDDSSSKERNVVKLHPNKIRKKSLTSAGFAVDTKHSCKNKSGVKDVDFKYSGPRQMIHCDVDDEIDVSYPDNYDSPIIKHERAHAILTRHSNSNERQKENESIVPPLALKNIGSSKNTQNTNTGKLTRTTMNTTQIRDKMPLNHLKNNVNSALPNAKSNSDCKQTLVF